MYTQPHDVEATVENYQIFARCFALALNCCNLDVGSLFFLMSRNKGKWPMNPTVVRRTSAHIELNITLVLTVTWS